MELIAKDTDDLADGSGKAHMTWLAKDIVLTAAMNSEFVDYTDSSLYTTILPDLKSGIDSTIQGYMKPVTKTRRDNSGTTQSSNETFWIPSYRETFGSTSKESSGCIYNFRFPSNAARVTSRSWWLRTYNSGTTYGVVRYDGAHLGYVVTNAWGVFPGFCI